MTYFIIAFIITLIIFIIVYSIIEEKTKYKDEEPDELSEKDKTLRALRALIYIVIALIIAGVAIKILFFSGILLADR